MKDGEKTKEQLIQELTALRQYVTEVETLIARHQQKEEALQEQTERERMVVEITQRIRQTLDLEEVLSTTVSEVRQFLQTERVFIYRFEPDWSGIVVVESVDPSYPSILKTQIKDTYFAESCGRKLYQHGRIQATEDIYITSFSQCHTDLLAQFQVRANLVVPILQPTDLWGLLIAHHCSAPRDWQPLEIELLKSLAAHVGIAIQHSELYQQLQTELSDRILTEKALRQSEGRFRRIAESGMIGIFAKSISGSITDANDTFLQMVGYTKEDLLSGKISWRLMTPANYQRLDEQKIEEMKRLGVHTPYEKEFIRKDGSRVSILIGAALIDGSSEHGVGFVLDITERKLAEAQLLRNAFYDALTGLPNRALFMERLERALKQLERKEEYIFAVLFLDLDRFKVVNDSLGHVLGDQLLIAIACRLKACLRSGDTIARLGGDEFTILLEGFEDVSYAISVAERIQAELTLPFNLGEQEVFTTASIGIALSTRGYEKPEEILRDADNAMYRAKHLGKAQYKIFDSDMYGQAVALLQLETELRWAIERQEFRIHYQPIISLFTGKITGFEALVRWQHPQRGLLLPAQFMPTAIETKLSIPIDEWVMYEACRQIKLWQQLSSNGVLDIARLTISVNLCKYRLKYEQLLPQICQVLQETDLDASSLKLEIIENIIMEHGQGVTQKLNLLKSLGIQLEIDDFGTGYSSLARLHRFPIDGFKIDRSFISGNDRYERNRAIVETIVTLAQKLEVQVTAEGVETAEQLALLRELKCEYGQGYFFSKPLSSQAAEALLVTNPQW